MSTAGAMYLHWLYWIPGNTRSSLSLTRRAFQWNRLMGHRSPAATRSSTGTQEARQPSSPNLCSTAAQCPAGRLSQHRWDCARKANSSTVEQPRLTSHQSNSSTTNITVLKGTTPPCSVPMLYANLHSLRPVQVHDSH